MENPAFQKTKTGIIVTFLPFSDILCMNRSATGFQTIYKRYVDQVYSFAFWLSGDAEEAKDITSETFLRLWTAKNDIMIETVKAYLFKIARNLFLQRRRNRKPTIALDADLADAVPRPDVLSEGRSELQYVLLAMQQLPEADRAALIMRSHDELSYREIAQVLNLSISAAKVKVHRARLKLILLTTAKENAP